MFGVRPIFFQRGILNNKYSIEPIASGRRSEDDLVAHTLLDLEHIDSSLADNSEQSLCPALDVGLSTMTERKLEDLPEEFVVEVRIFSDPSHNQNKTMDDLIKYFGVIMSEVRQISFMIFQGVSRILSAKLSNRNYTFTRRSRDPKSKQRIINLCGTVGRFYNYVKATLTEDTQDAVIYVSSPSFFSGCSHYCHVCKKNPVATTTVKFGPPGPDEARIIAHELGHLLGMTHEGYCPWYSTKGKKRLRCKGKDHGYVMGRGKPPHYFSYCLQDQAKGCLMTKKKRCFELTGGKKLF
ncbi:metalloprotease, putative [Ixodes scapularis]|uniref:Metalloprotease, putative n=1 Tax=Ixodes scapularis TaxID=6945 RepID=B7P2V7_IXOSC|nr:metalloprotease, putative [Ixodes scapularis]|eukprot:XP_002403073.1 metalloprotease, putative [Ixodes scapularis]